MVIKTHPHRINIVRDNTAYNSGEFVENTEILAENIPCYIQQEKSEIEHKNSQSSNPRNWKIFCNNQDFEIKIGDKIIGVEAPITFVDSNVISAVNFQTHLEIKCRC